MNLKDQTSTEQNTRVLGFTVAVELTEQELAVVSGGAAPQLDDKWTTGCGGRCTQQDVVPQ